MGGGIIDEDEMTLEEQEVIFVLEQSRSYALSDQEINLALEQAKALGEINYKETAREVFMRELSQNPRFKEHGKSGEAHVIVGAKNLKED
jgi:hypothetical protein